MTTLFKVLGFSFSLILVFTLVANLLPQIEGEAPVDEVVDLSELTMESFIDLGEQTFSGKGTCTLCHNNMGRAPDLLKNNVVADAQQRLDDQHYQGQALSVKDYLRESMIDPGIFVVAGFGKKGSNDRESPMPNVSQAPIELSEIEIDAIIAFLQAKDGNDVTVDLPSDAPMPDEAVEQQAKIAATPEEVLVKYSCTACHTILEVQSPVGPNLKSVGRRLNSNEIRESIVNPAAIIAKDFPPIMPPTIADNMTVKELEMLVKFLTEQKSE